MKRSDQVNEFRAKEKMLFVCWRAKEWSGDGVGRSNERFVSLGIMERGLEAHC